MNEVHQLRSDEVSSIMTRFFKAYPDYKDNAWHYKDEVGEVFTFNSFCYGFAFVTRKSDNKDGSLNFMHFENERIYFDFRVTS